MVAFLLFEILEYVKNKEIFEHILNVEKKHLVSIPCVSKRGNINGESKPNPPVRYRVGNIQVLLHPPG